MKISSPGNPNIRQANGQQLGVSLLELLIAISIMAAMAGVVAPHYMRNAKSRTFDNTVDGVVRALKRARDSADRTGEAANITISLSGYGTPDTDDFAVWPSDLTMSVEPDAQTIEFPGGMQFGTIQTLLSNKHNTVAITVSYPTGRIHVETP